MIHGTVLANRRSFEGGVVDVLLAAEQADPDRVLLRWTGGSWTVGAFADRARRWGTIIDELGVAVGDRVAVVGTNNADLLALQYGIYMRRAVEVSINAELRGGMLTSVLADADAAIVIAEAGLDGEVTSRLPDGTRLTCIDDALLTRVSAAEPCTPRLAEPHELALILHTSGTTGPSKGVMISHGYLPTHGASWASMLDLGPGDVSYFFLPFFHVDAHCVLPACLLSGSVFGFGRRFTVSRFWDEAAALGATWFIGVGSVVSALVARRPDKLPEHSLRIACAAPISDEVYPFFEDVVGIPLVQIYGQTEADCVVFTTPDRNPRGAAGWACAGFDIAVVDEQDRVLAAGEVGRFVYRPTMPNQLTMGYWRRPEATLEAARNLWWHTGDLARLDEQGTMYFAGRVSDSLRHRGENISAYELESALAEAPGVRRAIAVAVADDLGSEDEIKIFVVLDEVTAWDAGAFFSFCDQALPRYAAPRFVEPIEEGLLVLSPGNGAVQKHLLPREHGPQLVDRDQLPA